MYVSEELLLPVSALALGGVIALVVYRVVNGFVQEQFVQCCAADAAASGSRLYAYHEAGEHLQGNPYITHGYRQDYSVREAMRSLFTLHNETANIWSHFLGGLLFFGFTIGSIWDLLASEAHSDRVHQATVVVYCIGALSLLACSTSFHWLGCMSDRVYALTAKLDYTGIAVLILVSFFPFMYSLFYCHLLWGLFYSSIISLLSVVAIYVSWSPVFSGPTYHIARAALFLAIALFGAIPLPHACISIGLDRSWPVFWPLMLMGALYIGGALIYAARIPERWLPGKLNVIGHSHFIFHCCVVAAACVHYWNVHRLIEWRQATIGNC